MININCDLGEGLNNEHILLPLINSCKIACGGHAGDSQSMIECVEISIKNDVKIGAHPSYPDKENNKILQTKQISFMDFNDFKLVFYTAVKGLKI